MDPTREYSYLWDGSEEGWVVWELPARHGKARNRLIFNLHDRTALIIEDDVIASAVADEMLSRGCTVITKAPS